MAMGVAVRVSVSMGVFLGMSMIHRWMLYYNITEVHAWARSQTGVRAAVIARVLLRFRPQGRRRAIPRGRQATLKRGRREDRMRAAPAVSRAKCRKRRTRAYRFSGGSPAFPAQWFYGLYVISPVTGFLATVISEKLASQKLDASIGAPEPHDFTVRNQPRSSVVAIASTASHRTFVTIASRPSSRVGRADCYSDLHFG